MAGERHDRSQTVQVYDSLLPPPFRPGCGLSGKRSSCALIGPSSLDVTDSTFDTTNQREEAVGSARGFIRKWVGHCVRSSQWAARWRGARGSGRATSSECRLRLCIHGASRRAEVSRACSVLSWSPYLRPTAFQPLERREK